MLVRRAVLMYCLLAALGVAHGVPLQPQDDAEVVERLLAPKNIQRPAGPRSAGQAAREARQWLEQARAEGDPRLAGRAMAVLRPWADDARAPAEVVVMLATTEQYLHDFDGASRRLEALVARDPSQMQAWLTLATLRRVQGRYGPSDDACQQLVQGAALHAGACLAENEALRGQTDPARRRLSALLAQPLDGGTRTWLLTTLAELEERDGRVDVAERTYRLALAATPDDAYAALAYADLLIARQRPREALAVLARQVRSDAVLLRVAQAERDARVPSAQQDQAELRERYAQAALRPGDTGGHQREQSMFAWTVLGDLPAAVKLARINVERQREPIDVLLLARVARAAGDADALKEADRIKKDMGLHDRRIDALLS